jgi:hypothetical protein
MLGRRPQQQATAKVNFWTGANKDDPPEIYNWYVRILIRWSYIDGIGRSKIYVLTATSCMVGQAFTKIPLGLTIRVPSCMVTIPV